MGPLKDTNQRTLAAWALAAAMLASCQAPGATPGMKPVAEASLLAAYRRAMGPAAIPGPSAAPSVGFKLAQALGVDYLYGPPMPLTATPGDQQFPDVAYNPVPTTKSYLAVWEDARNGAANTDLYCQVVNASGILSGGNVVVSSAGGHQLGPRIAQNPLAAGGNYLVAWTDTRNGTLDVYTQLVDAAGSPVNGAGTVGQSPVLMASGAGNQVLHGLAHHPASNQYLLTWIDDAGGGSVLRGCRVSAANAKVSADMVISATPGALAGGGIAVNNSSGHFLVAWADARAGAPGIYTRQVSQTGTFPSAEALVASGAGREHVAPKVAFNPINPVSFLLVYDVRNQASGDADVKARLLGATGTATGAEIAVSSAAGHQMLPMVSCNRAVGNFMVTWADGRTGPEDLDLYGKMYTSAGALLVDEWLVNSGANVQGMPAIAYDSTKKLFMTVWQDARSYGVSGYEVMTQRVLSAVMTAQDLLGEMSEYLDFYYPGPSNGANSARSHLDNAMSKIAAGDYSGAINHIITYKDRVTSLYSDGFITAEELAGLIAIANAAIDAILSRRV